MSWKIQMKNNMFALSGITWWFGQEMILEYRGGPRGGGNFSTRVKTEAL